MNLHHNLSPPLASVNFATHESPIKIGDIRILYRSFYENAAANLALDADFSHFTHFCPCTFHPFSLPKAQMRKPAYEFWEPASGI
ncbi:MAG: hypothetical protein KGQ46_11775 [Hyphomicrobiales bacterium]|nr:hypothetical protein [Hyphomicrobiales bacterium]MDE2113729.1 hypothetical protein [Hyphomicrobiales bacterium]